ncbi:hypothetical protein M1384_01575 [Candidatus Parvarchaeota archaeon]|jgi:hypothetical protein|nr:hypothetical protein [Candidatus Parvarchaeota archaeon]
MGPSNLEGLLSNDKVQIKDKFFGYIKKHPKAYKLAVLGIAAFPEAYSVLLAEKGLNIIPSYEYQFAYVQHAAITLPITYGVAVIGTYIDFKLFSMAALKLYKYFNNLHKSLNKLNSYK